VSAPALAVAGLVLVQGAFRLDGIAFTVPVGGYTAIMGRTGCGKTSLVEAICGLRRPSAGRILIHGRDVTALPPGARGIGYVPQDGALFPRWRIADQLAFALRVRGVPAVDRRRRAEELADRLGLRHLLDRGPEGLSGGERQRVALGRALAHRPDLLLLDEPLAALDADTRDDLHGLLAQIHREFRTTVLHITHDPAEARRLADRVLRFADGRLVAEERP
jgi:ABC-type sugar transport system ATPase subunit